MKNVILCFVFIMVSTSAISNSLCDKPKDNWDGFYCLNKVYNEADKELNDNYQNLFGSLDAKGAAILKERQLDWIKQRNIRCSKSDKEGFFINISCATKQTINRAQILQNRYRECVSSGCQNSKL